MYLLYFIPPLVGLLCCVCISLYYKTQQFRLKLNEAILEIERLKNLPASKVKNLSVEAQQILHDMTAHGQAIVRITPISPTDIFWRSPR